ncbi:MAG: tRNA uridine-5-carboxymethylaminomethyl(34) synthesis enzyme MnmG [Elusimicrobia bacterium RIFOXYA1_FULL_47_7]|nr:MAG: tRNA uridine-5-carboxymethylaminomethyl(34) synthesis enzyme MnmG [Elusimicrobia bacterium RIFOXYA12_FULL_49_49]OGS07183.1 MAG: tRNA uridine-5-carboxymethylaminomethyl(34) synthesis enzyme MnmG [Elusimicrobia bacterium RIFOXYA1_FULL_47_7]OGS16420.1 MAG: tRNA uridine-5-carboxymethylaminomethyl(34) synthesis enzyme MnmG [Elusimicrobia bacterium RIFOXYA2_FULL_47_53]OGS27205.1 MAG: tRNA uridine-5-carboxymethylaminomethyl(34) synthesis enzyme MnmG [Elusimicrobia bacterium RIFOXYB12_FULL_50_12
MNSNQYDIIVIGAGHAGCEAALASSRMGLSTLLVTMKLDSVAKMSCNPAIGGLAKGQIVRELDALGGEMAKITDRAGLQFRMLNLSRGPAVWSPRAQCDKQLYSNYMRKTLEAQENLELREGEAVALLSSGGKVAGIELKTGEKISAQTVVITTGTFLRGLIHLGLTNFPGGRFDEPAAEGLSASLISHGLEVKRLKTGTPPRIDGNTIDFSKMAVQPGDEPPMPFSHFTDIKKWRLEKKQLPCWLTYTNTRTHEAIRKNMDRSPLYSGVIKSVGPRYCPSIEDKVVRFAQRDRHQVFLEPEGYDTVEFYANGISTSLPEDVQEEIVHSIEGLENARILKYGYAIEYDYCPPVQLKPSLETKPLENLFLAGQINGTTGYEEAAAQGFMAGVNACLKIKAREAFVLDRSQAYIGVLIDDLVTKGVDEPYRMFTSRSEYRLILRNDNADLRLMDLGRGLGLISDSHHESFNLYRQTVNSIYEGKAGACDEEKLKPWTWEQAELEAQIEKKYSGYINRQKAQVEKAKKMSEKRIPETFDYNKIPSLLTETRQKLNKVRPATLGQASRVSGVTPADMAIILIYLQKGK